MTSKVEQNRYSLKLKLEGLPKMSNQLLRGHWRVKHSHAVKWKNAVSSALRDKLKPPQPLTSAVLCLTRHSSAEPDFDGLVSSFKHLIDSLVEEGILESDKMSCIGQPRYLWAKTSPRKGFVTVHVESAA